MAVLEPSGLYYPSRFARYYLLAAEAMLSQNGLHAVLTMAGLEHELPPDTLDRTYDFAKLAAFSQALEEMYGARGGRGIALRIGREWFGCGMKTFGALSGLSSPAFRTLSQDARREIALSALTTVFNHYSDQQMTLEKNADHSIITVCSSPMAWGRTSDKPVCHALVGLLQACLNESSGGMEFHIVERECSAVGTVDRCCVFTIQNKPIGQ